MDKLTLVRADGTSDELWFTPEPQSLEVWRVWRGAELLGRVFESMDLEATMDTGIRTYHWVAVGNGKRLGPFDSRKAAARALCG